MNETPPDRPEEAEPSEAEIDALLQGHPFEVRLDDPALKSLEFPDILQRKVACRILKALRMHDLTLVHLPPKILLIFESSKPTEIEGISYMQYKAEIILFTDRGRKRMPYILYVPIGSISFMSEGSGGGLVH